MFEGEGTIRINSLTKRNLGALIVSVVNTDAEILEWFRRRFGGRIRAATGLRPDQRGAWVWLLAARQAAAFLERIQPFLVTTRNRLRCQVGLRFQAQKVHRLRQGPDYRQEQWEAFMLMKELNVRGPTANPALIERLARALPKRG